MRDQNERPSVGARRDGRNDGRALAANSMEDVKRARGGHKMGEGDVGVIGIERIEREEVC